MLSKLSGRRNRYTTQPITSSRCFYCNQRFGTTVYKKSTLKRGAKAIILRPVWDHIVPFVYTHNNKQTNKIPACHLCNAFKSGRIFNSVDDIRLFVWKRWETYTGVKSTYPTFPEYVELPSKEKEYPTPAQLELDETLFGHVSVAVLFIYPWTKKLHPDNLRIMCEEITITMQEGNNQDAVLQLLDVWERVSNTGTYWYTTK